MKKSRFTEAQIVAILPIVRAKVVREIELGYEPDYAKRDAIIAELERVQSLRQQVLPMIAQLKADAVAANTHAVANSGLAIGSFRLHGLRDRFLKWGVAQKWGCPASMEPQTASRPFRAPAPTPAPWVPG